jgi:hypothetical protein
MEVGLGLLLGTLTITKSRAQRFDVGGVGEIVFFFSLLGMPPGEETEDRN